MKIVGDRLGTTYFLFYYTDSIIENILSIYIYLYKYMNSLRVALIQKSSRDKFKSVFTNRTLFTCIVELG